LGRAPAEPSPSRAPAERSPGSPGRASEPPGGEGKDAEPARRPPGEAMLGLADKDTSARFVESANGLPAANPFRGRGPK